MKKIRFSALIILFCFVSSFAISSLAETYPAYTVDIPNLKYQSLYNPDYYPFPGVYYEDTDSTAAAGPLVHLDLIIDDIDFSGEYASYSATESTNVRGYNFNYSLENAFDDVTFSQLQTLELHYAVYIEHPTFFFDNSFFPRYGGKIGPFLVDRNQYIDQYEGLQFYGSHYTFLQDGFFFVYTISIDWSDALSFQYDSTSSYFPVLDYEFRFYVNEAEDFSYPTMYIRPLGGFSGGPYIGDAPPLFPNIWPDDDSIDPVTFPVGDLPISSSDLFSLIGEFSIVNGLIVSVGVLALSFFAFRIIVWK